MSSKSLTLKDIAQKLGFSVSTISLALKDSPRLPLETRRKVKEVADSLGYKRDDLYSILMSRRRTGRNETPTQTLAFICPFPHKKLWAKYAWLTRFYQGAAKRAEVYSCALEPFWLNEGELTPKRLDQIFKTRNIQGIVLGSFPESHTHMDMNWADYAAVAQGNSLEVPALHRVVSHISKSLKITLTELCRLGYKKIGMFLLPEVDARDRQQWSATYLAYQNKIPTEQQLPTYWWQHDETDFLRWMKKHQPEVIITTTSEIKTVVENAGYRVPDDVGLVITSWHPEDHHWAGINQQLEVAGATAIDMLINQTLTQQRGLPPHPLTVLVEGSWVMGKTVRTVGPGYEWDLDFSKTLNVNRSLLATKNYSADASTKK